ncbi:MAG: hypothetical protein P4M11_10260 [Candidatus Pacebacteria bacterium]|nr:hypothetical protein [Candidatus Paceibacterota bacterium]
MPIYKIALFPPRYRIALILGILVAFSQGIIDVFFSRYVCDIASNEATKMYCERQQYDPNQGFLAMLLLNIFTTAPTYLFLIRLERILGCN